MEKRRDNSYCEYFGYSVSADGGELSFGIKPVGTVLRHIRVSVLRDGKEYVPGTGDVTRACSHAKNDAKLTLTFTEDGIVPVSVTAAANAGGITVFSPTDGEALRITGEISFGETDDVSAVCIGRQGDDLRASLGPAASKIDDAVFDRKHDRALRFSPEGRVRLRYDFSRECYTFAAEGTVTVSLLENVYADLFRIPYRPINRHSTFPTPPAGWMTWYAVKFGACEEAVLENARLQRELFGDYGANTVWVDWEWYHAALSDEHPSPDVDFFHPDPEKYPHGLAYVADGIRREGFIPSLWVGPTVEPTESGFMKEHPDCYFKTVPTWCGRYFYDITDPDYLSSFVPAAFAQVREWGYEALKWDCLPVTLMRADEYHTALADPSVSSEDALRRVIGIARETLGEDFYMLSCSGEWDREILCAADLFDAARIGGDIFSWEEFKSQCVGRIMNLYALHNVMLYCDPDNLLVRPEFNTFDQAVTRTSFVSLLGLPVTLGDDLRTLPAERAELIRRALPPADIHPADIRTSALNSDRLIVNLRAARPFGEWNVVQIANLGGEETEITVSLDGNLHLDDGDYFVYDYWKKQYLGVFRDTLTLTLPACGSAVLTFHRDTGKKQILSTSRHITQGAWDIVSVTEEDGTLKGCSRAVAGEPYRIVYYDPADKTVKEKTLHPETTGEIGWTI